MQVITNGQFFQENEYEQESIFAGWWKVNYVQLESGGKYFPKVESWVFFSWKVDLTFARLQKKTNGQFWFFLLFGGSLIYLNLVFFETLHVNNPGLAKEMPTMSQDFEIC